MYLDAANGGSANQLTGYPNNQIPASMINSYSQKAREFLFPAAQLRASQRRCQQLSGEFNIPIKSNQGDVRLDQYVGTKHQFYARYTYKNKRQFRLPLATPVVRAAGDQ